MYHAHAGLCNTQFEKYYEYETLSNAKKNKLDHKLKPINLTLEDYSHKDFSYRK